jgi:hypothetical protein
MIALVSTIADRPQIKVFPAMKKIGSILLFLTSAVWSGCANTAIDISAFSMVAKKNSHAGAFKRVVAETDLEYIGSFLMPNDKEFAWAGWGLTFYSGGDSGRGSLFIIQGNRPGDRYGTAEISIPTSVKSKNPAQLNSATLLQPFANITKIGSAPDLDQIGDICYMQKLGNQTTDKLYWAGYEYYNVDGTDYASIGWAELTLSSPISQGTWHVGSRGNPHGNRSGAYLFEADHDWADNYTGGRFLLVGRHREGGAFGGSQGPTLYAIAPWKDGNPPAHGAHLKSTILLEYPGNFPRPTTFPGYAPCDNWRGAVWVKSGASHAVLIVGKKGSHSNTCYGAAARCADSCNSDQGYHCYPYSPQFLWYDVNELALVAQGRKNPEDVVPYSEWTPTTFTWNTGACAAGYGGAAYDSANEVLYVVELYGQMRGADWYPVIHTFRITSSRRVAAIP